MNGGPLDHTYAINPVGHEQFALELPRAGALGHSTRIEPAKTGDGYPVHDGSDEEQHKDHNLHEVAVDDSLSKEIAEARRNFSEKAWYLQAQSPYFPVAMDEVTSVRSTSPAALDDRPPSRPRSAHKVTALPSPRLQTTGVMLPGGGITRATNAFDKSTSYTDSGAERSPNVSDSPGNPNGKKRPIADFLDYDIEMLKQMPFSELEQQPFDFDPGRGLGHRDSTAQPSKQPHLDRLQNLRSLSTAERVEFFSSQTKDQWTASTTFFERRLAGLVEELGRARDRRREVTAKFEDEIRSHMMLVEESGDVIDRSLTEMRAKAKGVLPATGREENGATTGGG
jgi:hypothetical protein